METTTKRPGRLTRQRNNGSSQKAVGYSIIGKIRIGSEAKRNDEDKIIAPGRAIDYFRATGEYAKQFHDVYGDKPSRIEICFPSPDPEKSCFQREEGRDKAGRLCAYFDGVNHYLFNDKENNYQVVTERQYDTAKSKGIEVTEGYGSKAKKTTVKIINWSERLTMRFFLLKLKGIMGVWELSTQAVASSIPNITNNFDQIAEMAGANFPFVPFDLTVKYAVSNKPGNPSKYSVLTLTSNISYENGLLLTEFTGANIKGILNDDKIKALAENQSSRALPEAKREYIDEDTGEITNEDDDDLFKQVEDDEPEKAEKTKEEFTPEKFRQWLKSEAEKNPKPIIKNEKIMTEFIIAFGCIATGEGMDREDRKEQLMEYLFDVEESKNISQGAASAFTKWVNAYEVEPDVFVPEDKRIQEYKEICKYLDNQDRLL